jgi:hypothetical protein
LAEQICANKRISFLLVLFFTSLTSGREKKNEKNRAI